MITHFLTQILADIVEIATKAGTLPMQVLMLIAIITIGLVFRYYYRDSNCRMDLLRKDANDQIKSLGDSMDKREMAMTTERLSRIGMLMELIQDDTKAKFEIAHAVEGNAQAIRDLRELINEQREIISQAIRK